LEIYSGKALDWFEWIDLYRALVHDSGKSAGEKLAILKRHLKGDCLDLVQGLGGGGQLTSKPWSVLNRAVADETSCEPLPYKPLRRWN
jgi:hypothetical protein